MVPLFLRFLYHTIYAKRFAWHSKGNSGKQSPMPKHILLQVLFATLMLTSCKSIKPERPPASTLPGPPTAISSINIPIEIPLSQIEQRLNSLPKSKLFQDQGISLGSGLTADVDVDRNGAIKLQGLENSQLQVRLPMHVRGNLKFEKKVLGQVLATNIPFDENVIPQFSFRPEIGQDWNIRINQLAIDNWGRSLKYNLLGFEIDLEPLVKRQVQNVLENQIRASGLNQLDFKQTAQATWDQFSGSYTMEVEGMRAYVRTQPEAIRFSHEIGPDQVLRVYIGMDGNIAGGIGSLPKSVKGPLPSLSPNDKKDDLLDLQIPFVVPFSELDSYLNGQFSGQVLRLDSKTTLAPSNLQMSKYGDQTLLAMDFKAVRKGKKEIMGKMYIAGRPQYDAASKTIRLEKPQFDVRSDDSLSDLAMRLKRGKIQRQIRKVASFPIGKILEDAPGALEEMLHWELDFGTMSVSESGLDVVGIYQTENDMRVYFKGTGKIKFQLTK